MSCSDNPRRQDETVYWQLIAIIHRQRAPLATGNYIPTADGSRWHSACGKASWNFQSRQAAWEVARVFEMQSRRQQDKRWPVGKIVKIGSSDGILLVEGPDSRW
jgi:hypothetical protein